MVNSALMTCIIPGSSLAELQLLFCFSRPHLLPSLLSLPNCSYLPLAVKTKTSYDVLEMYVVLQHEVEMFPKSSKCNTLSHPYHPRPFRADQCGEDRAVPRGLPAGVRALHQLP